MYYLILWNLDKSSSIITHTKIVKWLDGSNILASWGGKSFRARVVAQYYCKKWLENLVINTNGIIIGCKIIDGTCPSTTDQSSITSTNPVPSTSSSPTHVSSPNILHASVVVPQLRKCPRPLTSTTPELNSFLPSPIPSTSKSPPTHCLEKDLIVGSKVRINEKDLFNIRKECNDQPKKMLRKLLVSIIGVDKLKTMSRTGGNNLEPIPKDILLAIEQFTFDASSEQTRITTKEFNSCVTQFLNDLRNPK